MSEKLIDIASVAEKCGKISTRTVIRNADLGLMPYGVKFNGRRLWRESELDSWIADGCKPVREAGRRAT